MSTKQKIRVTAEVIIIFVLLLTIWPRTFWTGYTESAASAIGTLAFLIGAVEIFLYRKSRIQAKAKESDPASREELERAADGIPIESTKTTEDVAQPVQLGEDLTESETSESTGDNQKKAEKKKIEKKRTKQGFSKKDEDLFNTFKDLGFIAHSEPMLEVFKQMNRYAKSKLNILLLGDRGTGKELAAKAIHVISDRRGKFIPVDCSSIPKELLQSELFGHEKGSFTSADRTKKGLFEEADGGTVFLDEIGDMLAGLQIKLRRAIQEKEIQRIGANATIPVDIRVVCGTNINLEDAMKSGKFRPDLYDRITGEVIQIPPLSARIEDIPLLCEHFFHKYCDEEEIEFDFAVNRKTFYGSQKLDLSGNVRGLENQIHRMVVWLNTHHSPSTSAIRQFLSGEETTQSSDIDGEPSISEDELNLLQAYISSGFRFQTTAKTVYRKATKRDTVQRTIYSIFLKIGDKFEFRESEIARHLHNTFSIYQTSVPELSRSIVNSYRLVLSDFASEKKKPVYYKADIPLINKLRKSRPDLV